MFTSGLGVISSPAYLKAAGSPWMIASILALPLAAAALWLNSPTGRRQPQMVSRERSTDIAVHIVTERYARGEIDLKEYQRLIVGLTS